VLLLGLPVALDSRTSAANFERVNMNAASVHALVYEPTLAVFLRSGVTLRHVSL